MRTRARVECQDGERGGGGQTSDVVPTDNRLAHHSPRCLEGVIGVADEGRAHSLEEMQFAQHLRGYRCHQSE